MKHWIVLLLAVMLSCSPAHNKKSAKSVQLPQDSGLDAPCVTMDQTFDNDSLDCLRTAIQPNMFLQHGDIAGTVKNLVDCSNTNATAANATTIVGHGLTGRIITGGGQSFDDNNKVVGFQDDSENRYWGTPFNDLAIGTGRSGMITLFSCWTGAGYPGAKLLHKIAKRTGRPVRARTGLAECKNNVISFEPGSVWQMASPDESVPPTSINPPQHASRSAPPHINLRNVAFDADKVASIDVLREIEPGERTWQTVPKAGARRLVDRIEFEHPQDFGSIFAAETARLKIYVQGDGRPVQLVVLGDRVVRDTAEHPLFYFTNDDFEQILNELVPSAKR